MGEGVGMVGRVAALMPFVCGSCTAIRFGLVAGAVGARVVGRATRATETTGREAVAVLEAHVAARLAGRSWRRRRPRQVLDLVLGAALVRFHVDVVV